MLQLLCPICSEPLDKRDGSAVCKNGHLFDCAKEGYYYLLSKHSRAPGDNKEMVYARRDFLDGGYYTPLADELANIVCNSFSSPITLLDAGVGTGFYLDKIISARQIHNDTYIAIDISKHAVRLASKRNPEAQCAVASVFDIPCSGELADVVICVFSPFAMAEYTRVLKHGGILIVAYPCDKHLIELRQSLYESVRPNATVLPQSELEGVLEKELCYRFSLDNAKAISDLLTMTPYAYRAPRAAIDAVRSKSSLTLTADFHISVLKKR